MAKRRRKIPKRSKKKQKDAGRRARANPKRRPAPPSVADLIPQPTPEQVEEAKERFEAGILAREEAAQAGEPLLPGMTHEVVEEAPDKKRVLKRRRFSAR
jgi:hypothetical protein